MIETPYFKTFKANAILEGIREGESSLYGFYSYIDRPYKSTVITDITNTNPAIITAPCHGIEPLDQISISDVIGMSEINNGIGEFVEFNIIDDNTIELPLVDSSTFSGYVSDGEIRIYHRNTSCGKGMFGCSDDSLNLIRKNILGFSKVKSDCAALVVDRVDYHKGLVYSRYDSSRCFDSVTATMSCDCPIENNTKEAYRPYVITSEGNVYYVIDNNDDAVSLSQPTHTTPWVKTYPDGYSWQYMYSIDLKNDKFVTADYVPVRDLCVDDGSAQWDVIGSKKYDEGIVLNIEILSSGSGYSDGKYEVDIVGDGQGALAEIEVVGGSVISTKILNEGEGYTYGLISGTFAPNTEISCFRVSISPAFTIGKSSILNMAPNKLMVVWEFDSSQEGKFMIDNSYCGYGVIFNLKEVDGSPARDDIYDQRNTLVLSTAPTTMSLNETIYSNSGQSIVTEIGGNNLNEVKVLRARPVDFKVGETVSGEQSGSTNSIQAIIKSDIDPGSGAIISYSLGERIINRDIKQKEKYRLVIEI